MSAWSLSASASTSIGISGVRTRTTRLRDSHPRRFPGTSVHDERLVIAVLLGLGDVLLRLVAGVVRAVQRRETLAGTRIRVGQVSHPPLVTVVGRLPASLESQPERVTKPLRATVHVQQQRQAWLVRWCVIEHAKAPLEQFVRQHRCPPPASPRPQAGLRNRSTSPRVRYANSGGLPGSPDGNGLARRCTW